MKSPLLIFVLISLVIIFGKNGVNVATVTSSSFSARYQKGTACTGKLYGTTKFSTSDGTCHFTSPTTIYNTNFTFNSMLSTCSSNGLYHFYSDSSCAEQIYQASSTCVQSPSDEQVESILLNVKLVL